MSVQPNAATGDQVANFCQEKNQNFFNKIRMVHCVIFIQDKFAITAYVGSYFIYGFILFRDFPDAVTWLGVSIIVGSGYYVFYRERALTRSKQAKTR